MKRKTLAFMSAFLLCASMIAIGQKPGVKQPIKAPVKVAPPKVVIPKWAALTREQVKLPPISVSSISGKITWANNSSLCIDTKCIKPEEIKHLTPVVYQWDGKQPGPNSDYNRGPEVPFTITWGKTGDDFQEYTITLKDKNKYNNVIVDFDFAGYGWKSIKVDPKKCNITRYNQLRVGSAAINGSRYFFDKGRTPIISEVYCFPVIY